MPSLNAKLDHDRNSDIEAEEDDIDIEKLVTDLLKSKSNSNLLCDILRYLQSDDLGNDNLAQNCFSEKNNFRTISNSRVRTRIEH